MKKFLSVLGLSLCGFSASANVPDIDGFYVLSDQSLAAASVKKDEPPEFCDCKDPHSIYSYYTTKPAWATTSCWNLYVTKKATAIANYLYCCASCNGDCTCTAGCEQTFRDKMSELEIALYDCSVPT